MSLRILSRVFKPANTLYFSLSGHKNRTCFSLNILKKYEKNFFSTFQEPQTVQINSLCSKSVNEKNNVWEDVIRKDPKYGNLLYDPITEAPELENKSELIKIFKQFYTDPNGVDLKIVPDLLEKELTNLTFDELLSITYWSLKCFEKDTSNESWPQIHGLLNNHLFRKDSGLTSLEFFKIFSVLSTVPCVYHGGAFRKKLNKFLEKNKSLSPQQFVLACKYYKGPIKSGFKISSFCLQSKLLECLPKISLEELEVILKFFSINRFLLYNSTKVKILEKFCERVESPDLFKFHYIAKVLSQTRYVHNYAVDSQNKILSCISNLSLFSLINLCTMNVFDHEAMKMLLEKTANKSKEEFSSCSTFMWERLMSTMSTYNFYDKELVDKIILNCEEFIDLKKNERLYYLSPIMNILSYLVIYKIYPENLLRRVMTEEFCEYLVGYGTGKNLKNWCFINCSLAIENPKLHCTVKSSTNKILTKAVKYYEAPHYADRSFKRMSYGIEKELFKIYGENNVCWSQSLPYFKGGFVMRFDKNLTAQVIPQEYRKIKNLIKKPTDGDHIWINICAETGELFLYENELTGLLNTKLRQLKALGFLPVVVHNNDWKKNIKQETTRSFLEDLISKALQEDNKMERSQ